MKAYLLTLIAAAILAILASQLVPDGERGGISKHVRLIASLFLICVLLSPVQTLIKNLPSLSDVNFFPSADENEYDAAYREQLQEAIDKASADYFTDMLTQTLCTELSVSQEELRCKVFWDTAKGEPTPTKVTVMLSGRAIWKDPAEIRA